MEIKTYLQAIAPLSVLDLLTREVLQNLLDGYSYSLGAGITVVYSKEHIVTVENMDMLDALPGAPDQSFHAICASWRIRCGHDSICRKADKLVAMKYFERKWAWKSKVYLCEPLGLIDMAYPLFIEDRIVGVLFGGQIIVSDFTNDWRTAVPDTDWLGRYDDNQHSTVIQDKIRSLKLPSEQKETLLGTLRDDPKKQHITVKVLQERIHNFRQFGHTMQGLLDELYKSRKSAAQQEMLRQFAQDLADISLATPEDWWGACAALLHQLTELPGINDVRIYVRKKSKYVCMVPAPSKEVSEERLPVRNVMRILPIGQLTDIPANKNPLEAVDSSDGNQLWGYRSENDTGSALLGSVTFVRGAVPKSNHDLLVQLCRAICAAVDVACLIFHDREADEAFRHKVAFIGHSFRTPLQNLSFLLKELSRASVVASSPQLTAMLDKGNDRIFDAREDLKVLLDSALQAIEEFDLVETLQYVLDSMQPIAKNHPCSVICVGVWPEEVFVRAIPYRIRRALTCLLDNAIKYSYFGPQFRVEVGVTVSDGHARVLLTNYGIGIPPDRLRAIETHGGRGEVADSKRSPRLGLGLGVPFAKKTFQFYGGWLKISSVPAHNATREEVATFHRYITTVEAAIRVARS